MPPAPPCGRSPAVATTRSMHSFRRKHRNLTGAAEHVVHLIHHGSTSAAAGVTLPQPLTLTPVTPATAPRVRDAGATMRFVGHDAATHRRDHGATG